MGRPVLVRGLFFLAGVVLAGCHDAYEPFAAIKVGMSTAEVKGVVGEPDAIQLTSGLPAEDGCRLASGEKLLLYRLKDSPWRFWQQAAERTVRLCMSSEDKLLAKDIQIVTR
jgi:hypothetical protein